MIDAKALERLHNSKDFLLFLEDMHSMREAWIAALHGASTEQIQQISGRIIAIDEMLVQAKYSDVTASWQRIEG